MCFTLRGFNQPTILKAVAPEMAQQEVMLEWKIPELTHNILLMKIKTPTPQHRPMN